MNEKYLVHSLADTNENTNYILELVKQSGLDSYHLPNMSDICKDKIMIVYKG